jgi:asparagine synthase (glutamine-hydrolysing)
MRNAVDFRLQADVPVGVYLSGGLDSSSVAALAAANATPQLRTFSITFDRPEFDESAFQRVAAQSLHTKHEIESIDDDAIARIFPDVVRHAETPLVRTAPAPLFLLSKLARENGIKVVLSGEGADEIFLGYDLFKETALREFCARGGRSVGREQLFKRLYPYVTGGRGGELWAKFFLSSGVAADPLFSHQPRMLLTSWIKQLYSPDFRASLGGFDAAEEMRQSLPTAFWRWSSAHRAAYLETQTLLSSYLLAAQGDRMLSAHGVEGRYPFLDPALANFANRLPVSSKRRGLKDKLILRRWARSVLPEKLAMRPKLPYRAPGVASFLGKGQPEYIADAVSPAAIRSAGIFEPRSIAALLDRCRSGRPITIREEQGFVAALTTQLFHRQFMELASGIEPLNPAKADVLLMDSKADDRRHEEVSCYGAA